jgi:LacI family transcriptional regulator
MISKSRVTVKDVAAAAGCSVMTVSNVVNKIPSVSPDIRERVLATIDKLGYKPNGWARELGRSRVRAYPAPTTRRFGCLLNPHLNKYGDPFYGEMIASLEEELKARNFELSFVENWDDSAANSSQMANLVGAQNIDVLVLLHCEYVLPKVKPLARSIVVFGSFWTDRSLDYISPDMMEGGWQATQHLLGLGHRRIAYMGPQAAIVDHVCREREAGYVVAMQNHPGRPPIQLLPTASTTPSDGYDAAMELLQRSDRPTAIFAHSDIMAVGVLKAAVQLGLSVPNDLSVVGFNDDELTLMTHPELTTVRVGKRDAGVMIAQAGVDRISHPKLPGRLILLPVELIVRGSTGPVQ